MFSGHHDGISDKGKLREEGLAFSPCEVAGHVCPPLRKHRQTEADAQLTVPLFV